MEIRECVVCGDKFMPRANNQTMCSKECAYEVRRRTRRLQEASFENNTVDDYLGDEIFVSELRRSEKPTSRQINATIALLDDFCVGYDDVPQFETVGDLERWKINLINKSLSIY